MSDQVESVSADIDTAPAPLDNSAILARLESFGEPPEPEDEAPAGDEPHADTETEEAEAPEGDEAPEADGDAEEPEDDASEPEPKKEATDDEETGTRIHRLRDGTQVSLSDLKKGFDRAREIERVLPQIQQERQRFVQEREQFVAQQAQFQPLIAQVATVLQKQLGEAPDPSLLESDPILYIQQKHSYDQRVAELRQVKEAEEQQKQAHQQQTAEQQRVYLVEQQQKLVEALPELRDPAKAQSFHAEFQKIGALVGFSPAELAKAYDHRLYKLVKLAARGVAAEATETKTRTVTAQKAVIAAKKVADKPPVTAPAARVSAGVRQAEASRGVVERAKKSGAKEDFLAALASFE